MTMRRGKVQPWSVEVDRERKGSKVVLQNVMKILYENANSYGFGCEGVLCCDPRVGGVRL